LRQLEQSVLTAHPFADVLGRILCLHGGGGNVGQPRLERLAAEVLFQGGGHGGLVLNHHLFQRAELLLAPVDAAGAAAREGIA
jgi:hypothetical protein